MDREQKTEERCVARVKSLGGLALKLALLGLRGFPDRTILLPGGRIFFVEFKRAGGGRFSQQQSIWSERLTDLGFGVYDVRSALEFETALRAEGVI